MTNPVQQFWDAFLRLKDRLLEEDPESSETMDALIEAVEKIDPGLNLEINLGQDGHELIVTADGERELFPVVEEILRAGPKLKGWEFLALKPGSGLPTSVEVDGVEVRMEDVSFRPSEQPDGTLGLQLYVKGLRPEQADEAHEAVLSALEEVLGERVFAEQIGETGIAETPGWLKRGGLIPLSGFEEFFRKRSTSSR